MNTSDVLIIGGGVIGLSIARELSKRGVKSIRLLEKGLPGREASWAAAGILAPQVEADEPDDFFRLCYESNRMYADFSDELLAETGVDIQLDQSGTLYVGFDDADITEIDKRLAWQIDACLHVDRLNRDEVLKEEPSVSPDVKAGLLFPDDGQVENRRLVDALIKYAGLNGIEVKEDTVVDRVVIENDRAVGVSAAGGETFSAPQIIICAGAWSSMVRIGDATRLPAIKPIRGQMICHRPTKPLCRHVIYSERGYLVPRAGGRLLAGATAEDVGFDKTTTDSGIQSLKETAAEIVPMLGTLPIADKWAGLRPFANGGRPIMGRVPEVDGLYVASGHFRNGILLAPITAKMIADEICGLRHDPFLDIFGIGINDAAQKR